MISMIARRTTATVVRRVSSFITPFEERRAEIQQRMIPLSVFVDHDLVGDIRGSDSSVSRVESGVRVTSGALRTLHTRRRNEPNRPRAVFTR